MRNILILIALAFIILPAQADTLEPEHEKLDHWTTMYQLRGSLYLVKHASLGRKYVVITPTGNNGAFIIKHEHIQFEYLPSCNKYKQGQTCIKQYGVKFCFVGDEFLLMFNGIDPKVWEGNLTTLKDVTQTVHLLHGELKKDCYCPKKVLKLVNKIFSYKLNDYFSAIKHLKAKRCKKRCCIK